MGKETIETILAAIDNGVVIHDRGFRVLYQNQAMKRIFGDHDGRPTGNEPPDGPPLIDGAKRGGYKAEREIEIDGKTRVVEKIASQIRDAAGEIIAAVEVFRDLTEWKKTEERLSRFRNLYNALSHTNRAIMSSRDRDALFREICRVAVSHGRFSLAWIGLPDADGFLRPVAYSGRNEQYLESLIVSVDANREEGRGPSGIAIRKGTPYICNDFLADPHTTPWREAALKNGIRASAVFPLTQAGQSIGAFKVYSDRRGFFDDEMVDLLQEMAANISFALDNLSRDEQRQKAEEALRESEERLKLVLEGSNSGFWDWDVVSDAVNFSRSYIEMLGYPPGEIEPTEAAIRELIHPDDCPRVMKSLNDHLTGLTPAYAVELRLRMKAGGWVWIINRGKVVARDASGAPLRVAGTSTDISERKQYEENLRYLSTHDRLTGLFNRAYFEAELDRLAVSRQYPVSIVIADVDGLKLVNDQFGHLEGDRLIKQAAQVLREAFRAEDVVARIGGDEFAVLLPATGVDAVKEMIRRVRKVQHQINQANPDYSLSISIGSATAERNEILNDTLKLADSRMYHYKFRRRAGDQTR